MQNITLIGGSGFIGTRLAHRLKRQTHYKVCIFDQAPSLEHPHDVVLGDVRSVDQLRAGIADNTVLIHLAAAHRDDIQPISLYDDINIGGANHICTIAREKNIRKIIFTSSVAVYGFAPVGTDESGAMAPFNDYGRTKLEAERVFQAWQSEAPHERTLVILRPTVVFGEQNRGNVYNLLRQIASGVFIMIGDGLNRKSMAYVENVAALIEYTIGFSQGLHIYNYIDKPDYTMNALVAQINRILGRSPTPSFWRLPFGVGLWVGKCFDFVARLTGKRFPISSIRVQKFCANTVFNTSIAKTGFIPPVPLEQALEQTVRYEFIESNSHKGVFYSE